MSEPRVVWSHVSDRHDADTYDEAPHDGWSLGVWLPITRDESGAVSVKVGDLTVRFSAEGRPEVHHGTVGRVGIGDALYILLTAASKATVPGDDHA